MVLAVGARPLQVRAPCRVVYAVTEPGRRGLAYGTLPGHPECGEEAFMIDQRDDGSVVLSVIAFSRPATVTARVAGPPGRLIQQRVTHRYLDALADRRDN